MSDRLAETRARVGDDILSDYDLAGLEIAGLSGWSHATPGRSIHCTLFLEDPADRREESQAATLHVDFRDEASATPVAAVILDRESGNALGTPPDDLTAYAREVA